MLVVELTPAQPAELAWLEPNHKVLVVLPAMWFWKVHENAGVSELPVLVEASTGELCHALPLQSENDRRPEVVCMPIMMLSEVGSLFKRCAPTTPPALGPVCVADQTPVLPRVR
ncbi:hypothetical protein AQB9606_00004 [Aquabacterium sp. CECT 9606]|nr:hypothetical protein AQB9606_00004 [Aquabacterium sp. CECT 9606]